MTISRRDLLGALPAVALLPRALTAQAPRQLRVRGLHSMTLAVTDVKRSLEFYQGLFGMPIQARHGDTPLLARRSGAEVHGADAGRRRRHDGGEPVRHRHRRLQRRSDRRGARRTRRHTRRQIESGGGGSAESAGGDARRDAGDLRVRSERGRSSSCRIPRTAAAADRSATRAERCSRRLRKG